MVKFNTSYLSMNGTGLFTPIFLFSKERGAPDNCCCLSATLPEDVALYNTDNKGSNNVRLGLSMTVSIATLKHYVENNNNFKWL